MEEISQVNHNIQDTSQALYESTAQYTNVLHKSLLEDYETQHILYTIDEEIQAYKREENNELDINPSASSLGNQINYNSAEPNNHEVIDDIYKSMSKIINALNTDIILLNEQINKIRGELSYACDTIIELKNDNQSLVNTYTAEISTIMEQLSIILEKDIDNPEIVNELTTVRGCIENLNNEVQYIKSKTNNSVDLQKQILDTRTMLLHTISSNMQGIKKDLVSMSDLKTQLRTSIKQIILEEVQQYMASMPSIEQRFEQLAKDHRASISQHIRKSSTNTPRGTCDHNEILAEINRAIYCLTERINSLEQKK